MKDAGKILIAISIATALFLMYVHEQIALFRISYAIDASRDARAQKAEAYRRLEFEVEQLKAPRLLEQRMKDFGLDLTLPKEIRVVRVPQAALPERLASPQVAVQPFSAGLTRFLGRWVDVAQAKTDS